MFIGILIGFFMFGVIMIWATDGIPMQFGLFFLLVGLCGSLGWNIEVAFT